MKLAAFVALASLACASAFTPQIPQSAILRKQRNSAPRPRPIPVLFSSPDDDFDDGSSSGRRLKSKRLAKVQEMQNQAADEGTDKSGLIIGAGAFVALTIVAVVAAVNSG